MKKVSDLMSELGFREDAPQSVKEAFIKHLIKAAEGIEVSTPTEKKIEEKIIAEQLSFFDVRPQNKKVSSF